MTLTFESADESSLPVLSHGTICFSQNEIWTFGRICFLLNLAVKGLKQFWTRLTSLRSWRYCVGARLKFRRRSRVPKRRSRDEFSRLRRS